MKSPGYIFAIIYLLSNSYIASSQYNIQYTSILSDDNFVFTRIIDGKTYHFSHKTIGNVDYGSEIIQIEAGVETDISWIYQINDSLFCHKLIDMWDYDDKFLLLAYTFANDRNYISLIEYDINSSGIYVIASENINEYRSIFHYNFKDLIIDGIRYVIILEHIKDANVINGIYLFKLKERNLSFSKYTYQVPIKSYLLFDQFYDEQRNLIYLLNNKTYLKFDLDFIEFKTQNVVLKRNNRTYRGAESNIIGIKDNKLVTYERLSPTNSNLILSRREITIKDTFDFDEEFTDFNPDEDCYLVRKIFKDSCNYMYYSRSTINKQNSEYGFNIITFNKQGVLLNNQVFKSDRPLAVYDIDIDETEKKISGVGGYFDDFTQFSFTADLKKQMVNTIDITSNKIDLLVNNIGNQFLYINPSFQNKVVNVFSINGQLVYKLSVNQTIDISMLVQGNYFIQYYFENKIKTERFTKT